MADFDDDSFEETPEDGPDAEREAALEQMISKLPPELYGTMQPLLLIGLLANHMLLGHADDPVPQALHELLGYDLEAVQKVGAANDTPSLGLLMATNTQLLFDFLLVTRLVFDSPLEPQIRAHLRRQNGDDSPQQSMRDYVLPVSDNLLASMAEYLSGGEADALEELRLRRLQTESIFVRLDDTLRLFYAPGTSPEELAAAEQDRFDELEDAERPAVHIRFNDAQLLVLSIATQLPPLLAAMGETPFARALPTVPSFRKKALQRLTDRLREATPDEEFPLAWSELLRLYQAAQVYALSVVADVVSAGTLMDALLHLGDDDPDASAAEQPGLPADQVEQMREMVMAIVTGFVEVVESNHVGDLGVETAKEEISQLAGLLE